MLVNEQERKRPLHFHYHPKSLRSPDPYTAHKSARLFRTSLLYYSNQTSACLSSSAIPNLCQEEEPGRCRSPPLTPVIVLAHSSNPSLRPNRAFFAQIGYPLKLANAQMPQMLARDMDAPDWGFGGNSCARLRLWGNWRGTSCESLIASLLVSRWAEPTTGLVQLV